MLSTTNGVFCHFPWPWPFCGLDQVLGHFTQPRPFIYYPWKWPFLSGCWWYQYSVMSAIVMHIWITNCSWCNSISGLVLNQLFSSGAIIMHLGPWGNLIGAKLIVQWRCLIDCSTVKLIFRIVVRHLRGMKFVRSLHRFFVNVQCVTELWINQSHMGIFSKQEQSLGKIYIPFLHINLCMHIIYQFLHQFIHLQIAVPIHSITNSCATN